METKKIPDSELEIMMVIWDAADSGTRSVTSDYIMERLHKSWVKTTLLNLLTRLVKRGFLSCEKDGRLNIYSPLVERGDYVRDESRSFLQKLHHGSLKSLVASLYDGEKIPNEDIEEFERLIREAK